MRSSQDAPNRICVRPLDLTVSLEVLLCAVIVQPFVATPAVVLDVCTLKLLVTIALWLAYKVLGTTRIPLVTSIGPRSHFSRDACRRLHGIVFAGI